MSQASRNRAVSAALVVKIPYTVDTGEKLVNETFGPNNIRRRRGGTEDPWRGSIQNGRPFASPFSLALNGFIRVEHKTAVRDFLDKRQVESVYYPEVDRLIKKAPGAVHVVVLDHTLCSGDESEREARLIREPVLSAYNDCTEWSGSSPFSDTKIRPLPRTTAPS